MKTFVFLYKIFKFKTLILILFSTITNALIFYLFFFYFDLIKILSLLYNKINKIKSLLTRKNVMSRTVITLVFCRMVRKEIVFMVKYISISVIRY